MTTIWKFALSTGTSTAVEMPAGANVLCVEAQHGSSFLWAIVDATAPKETRNFRVYGTGHEIKDIERLKFINTFFVDGKNFVFHAFEVLK